MTHNDTAINGLTCPHCATELQQNEHGDYPCENCNIAWGVDTSGGEVTFYDELGHEWGPALL